MKIAYCSDLHLEHGFFDLVNEESADVLVLAGDIYPAYSFTTNEEKAVAFFKFISEQFKTILYVAGNHEHYEGDINTSHTVIKHILKDFKNVHVLENETFTLDGITFIGSTLWTDMDKGNPLMLMQMQTAMNDYEYIHNGTLRLTTFDTYQKHKESLEFIESELDKWPSKVVMISHHAPSELSINSRYKYGSNNAAYYSDLSSLILDNPNIKLWFHGHVHSEFDYMLGETNVRCNPRGYNGYEYRAKAFKLKYVEL